MAGSRQESVSVATSPIRLNLGCGKRLKEGFINVDLPGNWSGQKPDVETDLRDLPFEDNYADEAMAIHVLEHFYLWEVHDILDEWVRVLKPGGRLIIEVPCLDKVVDFLRRGEPNLRYTLFPLYGDPSYQSEAMCHRWCYSQALLKQFMEAHLESVEVQPAKYHFPERDMRVVGVKRGA